MNVILKSVLVLLLSFCCFSSSLWAQVPEKAEDISPLLIGELLPDARLQDAEGNPVMLRDLLNKPAVLVFYRGGWCPYCSTQLSGLAKIEQEILASGFQLLAVSPDDYLNLKTTEGKENINYTLLSDPGGKFIEEIGIAFRTPEKLKDFIASKEQKGQTSEVMPVPTVMVLDATGKILFEYINPNYKERMSEDMLTAIINTLKP